MSISVFHVSEYIHMYVETHCVSENIQGLTWELNVHKKRMNKSTNRNGEARSGKKRRRKREEDIKVLRETIL